ncbi:MAG: histone-lysine N-methyltransferase [Thermodesulfobacteriota bacterium]
MAHWNKERRLLDHDHTYHRRFQLIDSEEPDLRRDIYPYHEICRVDFNHQFTTVDPAKTFLITDTTFRDGQQARPPYTVRQIVDIFQLLGRLSGPRGIVRQSEFFLYSQKDKEAVEKCLELGLDYPEITGWIRADIEDLQLVKAMGLAETGILASVSDYHIYLKLGLDRGRARQRYLAIAQEAMEQGIVPRCHFEDVTRADIYGFVVPFAQDLKVLSERYGLRVKVRLCDTLGLGVTYPGAALPRSVPKLVRAMIDDAGLSGEDLEWHGHNDFHKSLINAASAWLYGLSAANGTLLGFGERTGNTPIEALAIELIALRGDCLGMDTQTITEIADYFERELGYRIPPNYPFVGRDFNATSAGIHVDGLIKNEEIYNIFDTKAILNRPITITVTDKSGAAAVAHWVNTRLKLTGDLAVDKKHPGIVKMTKAIQKEYEAGRVTSMSNQEMEKLARKYLPQCFRSEFDRLKVKARELAYSILEEFIETPAIRSMIPSQQETAMQAFLDAHPFLQFMYVTDANGYKITKNVTHITERAKFETQFLGDNLSDRVWFVEPMKDGKIHVTDFYTSRFTGALCITVSGPIRNEEDEIVGVIGLDIRFEDLAKMEAAIEIEE